MLAQSLQRALCCWSAQQQSPPTTPISPCSICQATGTCTCSPIDSSVTEEKTVITNSTAGNIAPQLQESASISISLYSSHSHRHSHQGSVKDTNQSLPSEKPDGPLERSSFTSSRHSTTLPPPLSPAAHAQSQLRRQSSAISLASTASTRSDHPRGFLSSSSTPSQDQHLPQIQSSPTKASSKKFSLQKFYYPRNSMSAPSPSSDSDPALTNVAPPSSPAPFKSTPGSFSRVDSGTTGPLAPLAFESPRTLGLIPTPSPVLVQAPPTPPTPTLSSASLPQPPLLSLTDADSAASDATKARAAETCASAVPDMEAVPADQVLAQRRSQPLQLLTPSSSLSLPTKPVSKSTSSPPSTDLVLPPSPSLSPLLPVSSSLPPTSTLSLHPFLHSSLSTSSYSSTSSASSSISAISTPNTSPSSSPTETTLKPLLSSPSKSDLTPFPASSLSPAGLASMIEKGLSNEQGVSAGPRPLVLDLRSNPDFDPISIVHSININLPTLLMRRYRRGGAVTAFALESFITMPADKDLFHLIQDGWRQDQDQNSAHDVVVLDQDMKSGLEEFGRSPSPAWTLLNVLERGGGNCGGPIRLWYLEGGFEAFQTWDESEKFMVRLGSSFEINVTVDGLSPKRDPNTVMEHQVAGESTVHPHSMPLSLPSCSTPPTMTDAQTAQAIENAVSLTNASLGGTPRQRGAPVRRESLFSLNTKSLQRPSGLSRAQTIGVSALNIKPLTIPPLPTTTLQPLQEGSNAGASAQAVPALRHKGSWLTVPTGNTPTASPLTLGSASEQVLSASPDHMSMWSARSGGSTLLDSASNGSQLQRLGSKKSFSSTSTLISLNGATGTSQGIQEEDEENQEDSVHPFQPLNGGGLRRHHSGASFFPEPNTMAGDKEGISSSGRMFADGIDSHTNNTFHSSGSNSNMMAMLVAQQHYQHQNGGGYEDDFMEEGGDDGEQEISCILPSLLYLGPEIVTEEQVQELERLGIKRVLNMARECEDLLLINRPGIEYQKIGVQDHVEADVSEGLMQAVDMIALKDTPIYVHCKAGKSRSVTAIIAYLITQLHWSLDKAYNHVLARRPCMCPNIGFVTELMRVEERTLGIERAGGLTRAGSLNSILSLSTAGSGTQHNHHHHHHSLQHHPSTRSMTSGTAGVGSPKMLSTKSSMNSLAILSSPPPIQP